MLLAWTVASLIVSIFSQSNPGSHLAVAYHDLQLRLLLQPFLLIVYTKGNQQLLQIKFQYVTKKASRENTKAEEILQDLSS